VNGILDKIAVNSCVRPDRQMKFADLHLHTQFSDGTFTPEELVGHGARLGFAALALTDHDTVEGCARMAARARRRASSSFRRGTHRRAQRHGIARPRYFPRHANQKLLAEIAKFQPSVKPIREMVALINELGVPLEAESVFCRWPIAIAGPAARRRALVKAGLGCHLDEGLRAFLKKNRPAWVPKKKVSRLKRFELGPSGRRTRGHGRIRA